MPITGYLINPQTGDYEGTAELLPTAADGAACGMVTMQDGSKIVVVAGGYEPDVRVK